VYHSHNLHLIAPLAVSSWLRRKPLVYDAHELTREMARRPLRSIVTRIERAVWHRAIATITTNSSRREYLVGIYGPPDPLVLANVPNVPVEIVSVDLHGMLAVPPEQKILIYQGGLYVERGFPQVAEALARLPEWQLVLIGFGSPGAIARLDQAFAKAGVTDRVHRLPAVPPDQLLSFTTGADLGIIPLLNDNLGSYLGDTNKMFEYLMAGKPAVGSDFPELRRVLVEDAAGPLGAVFDPEDPDSIVAAVRGVEPSLEAMSQRALVASRTRYSWDLERLKLISLYSAIEELSPAAMRYRIYGLSI
jgi:glycosyltransferase involved in cell wall biosynthesis